MKLTKYFIITLAVISIMIVQSCSNDDNNKTARVQLELVDLPGDYLEVNVNIVDIQYNSSEDEEGWRSFESFEGPIFIDLTQLIAGNSLLLTDELIPTGMLKQIRLVLGDGNEVKIEGDTEGEGETFVLDTPSALQSGLKLNLDTVLEGGFSYTFILDWDVQKSVVVAGNSGMYNLKPVIKVNAEVNSGSIGGRVIEMIEEVETVLEGETIVELSNGVDDWSTFADSNGDFLFQGLPEGVDAYTLKIDKSGYVLFELEDVDVTLGDITNAGTIELITE